MSITLVLIILAATLMGADVTEMEFIPRCDVTHLAEQDTTHSSKTCCFEREPGDPMKHDRLTTITGAIP